jgi:dihydroorotate dehydrogenase (NAD+) catalytic subunit
VSRNGAVATDGRLAVDFCGIRFQNPVLLAAGTAAYGEELEDVVHLDRLGGIVTKAVSLEPRHGAPAPRVAEFDGGMMNAVGLANPGVAAVRTQHLPWLGERLRHARVIVNVIGFQTDEFARVIEQLGDDAPVHAYELNVSCPNTKAGGTEFGADPRALRDVVAGARAATRRPLIVKLSPTLTDIGGAASTAVDAGADAISVVNTIPGLAIDVEQRRPVLGYGTGGVSGPGLLPVGVLATWKVRKATRVPIIGIGGISSADAVLQYTLAGASLVAVGTGALRDPRLPERIVRDLTAWCAAHDVTSLADLVGALQWPT